MMFELLWSNKHNSVTSKFIFWQDFFQVSRPSPIVPKWQWKYPLVLSFVFFHISELASRRNHTVSSCIFPHLLVATTFICWYKTGYSINHSSAGDSVQAESSQVNGWRTGCRGVKPNKAGIQESPVCSQRGRRFTVPGRNASIPSAGKQCFY